MVLESNCYSEKSNFYNGEVFWNVKFEYESD